MDKPITTLEELAAMIHTHMTSKEDVHASARKVTEGFERIEHGCRRAMEQ
jgi:hypothetical protein